MTTNHQKPEAIARGARMLRTALGPAIARLLEDPAVVEVMLNPDGRLWVDRLSEGLSDTGERLSAADGVALLVENAAIPHVSRLIEAQGFKLGGEVIWYRDLAGQAALPDHDVGLVIVAACEFLWVGRPRVGAGLIASGEGEQLMRA